VEGGELMKGWFKRLFRPKPVEDYASSPRRVVADVIARSLVGHAELIVGPSYQTGPLGGEMESIQLAVRNGEQVKFVRVNIYGPERWDD
jgi:hypothetical protein